MRKFISILLVLCLLLFPCLAYADDEDEDTNLQDLIKDTERYLEETSTLDSTDLRVTPQNTTGLQSIILSLLGNYEPIVKDYTYTSSNGYTSHSIDIQPDYSWLATAAIFLVVVYCALRFIGGIFSGR